MAVRRWVVVSILLMHTFAGAQDWFPFPVEVWDPPFDVSSPRKQQDYVPLGEATGDWRIGVSFPHMKDAYWLAVNYGIVDEARRLGVGLDLVQAGGYEHLDRQIEQIREQAASGIDGVVIASISLSGMDTLVADLARAGIPVIDAVNGMNSDHLAAKSLVSFGEMGGLAGSYLAERHQGPGDTARVAWFPGPEAAGWVLLALLAPASFSLVTVFAGKFRPPDAPSATLACGLLLGSAVLLVPVMFGTGQLYLFPGPSLSGDLTLLYASLLSVLIFYVFLEMVRLAGPVFATQHNYIAVLAGFGWGALIFGEAHSVYIWGATALMFAGLTLHTLSARRAARAAEA